MHSMKAVGSILIFGVLYFFGCASPAKKAVQPSYPQTPDKVVENFAQKLAANDTTVVWDGMPKKYQQDVKDVLTQFGEKTDKELYNQTFSLLNKLTTVLKTKKEFIVKHPMLSANQNINQSDLQANYDGAVGLFETITNSELKELDKVAALDVRNFLKATGNKLLQQIGALAKLAPKQPGQPTFDELLRKLQSTKATIEQSSELEVTLKIEAQGEEPKSVKFQKVEDRWIPKDMADEWELGIAKIKTSLNKTSKDEIQKTKPQILAQMKTIEGMLDLLNAAKTEQEFNISLQQGILMVAGAVMGMMGGGLNPAK